MAYAEGRFAAEVIAGVLTTASTGTLQVAVEFKLEDGPNAGSRIVEYLAVTEKALPYTVEKLRTCGWVGEDLEDLHSIQGGKVELTLALDPTANTPRTRVKYIDAPRKALAVTPAAAGIAAQWRDRIRALSAPDGKPPF